MLGFHGFNGARERETARFVVDSPPGHPIRASRDERPTDETHMAKWGVPKMGVPQNGMAFLCWILTSVGPPQTFFWCLNTVEILVVRVLNIMLEHKFN